MIPHSIDQIRNYRPKLDAPQSTLPRTFVGDAAAEISIS
jgi:hypothetical protein